MHSKTARLGKRKVETSLRDQRVQIPASCMVRVVEEKYFHVQATGAKEGQGVTFYLAARQDNKDVPRPNLLLAALALMH